MESHGRVETLYSPRSRFNRFMTFFKLRDRQVEVRHVVFGIIQRPCRELFRGVA
jgi:hypothetical protein